jgi:putative nucleotide binding protein
MYEREQPRKESLEDYAIVLDYLPTGKSFSVKSEPITQLLGEERFTLLEAILKPGTGVKNEERVYIGKGERDKIQLIKLRITYNELTEGARNELPHAISQIIKGNEKRFIDFFNGAGPINIREHSLELLPGIGKRYLNAILKAREEKPFESFQDMSGRVQLLQDPVRLLVERVIMELKGESRFYILTRPYSRRYE